MFRRGNLLLLFIIVVLLSSLLHAVDAYAFDTLTGTAPNTLHSLEKRQGKSHNSHDSDGNNNRGRKDKDDDRERKDRWRNIRNRWRNGRNNNRGRNNRNRWRGNRDGNDDNDDDGEQIGNNDDRAQIGNNDDGAQIGNNDDREPIGNDNDRESRDRDNNREPSDNDNVPTIDIAQARQTDLPDNVLFNDTYYWKHPRGEVHDHRLKNSYLVVFKDGITNNNITAHSQWISNYIRSSQSDGLENVPKLYCVYSFGYAGYFTEEFSKIIAARPEVEYVEQDTMIYSHGYSTSATSWGLDRIDQRALPLDNKISVPGNIGSGVDIYIVDTGIFLEHSEFEGRAQLGISFSINGNDDNVGHGTHVAAIAAGKTFGVARNATLIAVKVIDNDGSGAGSNVIMGLQWIIKRAKERKRPSVINMSIGGSKSNTLDRAVLQAIQIGIVVVSAAGNDYKNACSDSPGNLENVITTGSTGQNDAISNFSNFGKCVKIFAPGTQILSAWIGSADAVNTLDGTSMASPYVAGAAALLLSDNPKMTPVDVMRTLISRSTPGLITEFGSLPETPNQLLFIGGKNQVGDLPVGEADLVVGGPLGNQRSSAKRMKATDLTLGIVYIIWLVFF